MAGATAHFRAPLEVARDQRAQPLVVQIEAELAAVLVASGEDRAQASELLEDARQLADALASEPLRERVEALTPPTGALAVDPAPLRRPSPLRAALVLEGEVWSFSLRGRTVRVRDSKGMQHLAELRGRPGVEIHALELAREWVAGASSAAAAAAGLGEDRGTGPWASARSSCQGGVPAPPRGPARGARGGRALGGSGARLACSERDRT